MRRARSAVVTSVVVVVVAGVLAALAYGAWVSRHRTFSATTTLQVFPLPDTGDPDRVLASLTDVLESRTERERVAARLPDPAPFTIEASQQRLSNVMDVTATSADRATATRAAADLASTYPAQAEAAVPPLARLNVLDPPLAATVDGSERRDAVLVGLGAAALAVAVLVLFYSLRPRVRRSYDVAPVEAVLLELPEPGRAGSERRAEISAELRRFADHVIALRGGDARPQLRVCALPGVDDATVGWVAEVLSETSATVAEPTVHHGRHDGETRRGPGALVVRTGSEVTLAEGMVPATLGDDRPFSVLVARAGVDAEADLRKEAGSRAVFSEVVVVLLGSARPALVLPADVPGPGGAGGRRADDGRHRGRRLGQTVWR